MPHKRGCFKKVLLPHKGDTCAYETMVSNVIQKSDPPAVLFRDADGFCYYLFGASSYFFG